MIVPVTRLEYEKGETVFANVRDHQFVPVASDEASVAAFIREHKSRAVVLGVERYVGPLYQALPKGGIILRFGVGFDSIDRVQAKSNRIVVANTPGTLDRSVAEHCIFLISALVRHITQGNHDLKSGDWVPHTGDELGDFKLAVVGLGRIGSKVAQIAHLGFGMETLICEIDAEAAVASRLGFSQDEMGTKLGYTTWSDDLGDVLPEADVVTVHMPLLESTAGIFDASRFSQFKTGSLFVNQQFSI